MIDVAIVGAGVSGLTAAVRLKSLGHSVTLLEADAVPGGKIRTDHFGSYQVESGPHSFLGSSHAIWQLLTDTALLETVLPATDSARIRYIYRDGKIHPLPMNPLAFASSRLLSTRGKLRLIAEPFIRGAAEEEDTLHDFIARRFGTEAAQYLAGPFVSGIYAGDPHRLGAFDSFPTLWGLEHNSGSLVRGALGMAFNRRNGANGAPRRRGLFSFPGGLGEWMLTLASRLGPCLKLNSPVDQVRREGDGWQVGDEKARAVIVATQPQAAAAMLAGKPAALLRQIRLAPVSVVHLGCATGGEWIPPGFGYLIPRTCAIRTLGTVFVSQIFSNRAPVTGALLTSFIGGALDAEAIDLSDDNLLEIALADFQKVVGMRLLPDFTMVRRHPQAIPQLEVGHRRRIEQIEKLTDAQPGLFLAGNYLSGVGMNDAVASGYRAADRAQQFLCGRN